MKAKDTVIKARWMNKEVKKAQEILLLEQAEISFKAGIKVVVDWCNDNFEPAVPMTLDYRKWHKQLEEWGL
uniref:Uncharacterized protein n=1 Tax=viral metagenome TaxID=1070528 RepID=A0A6H2A6M3_9ZZZZ